MFTLVVCGGGGPIGGTWRLVGSKAANDISETTSLSTLVAASSFAGGHYDEERSSYIPQNEVSPSLDVKKMSLRAPLRLVLLLLVSPDTGNRP